MFVTAGGLRIDYLITHTGEAHLGLLGGNALYAAVGAAIWQPDVNLWARIGVNFPHEWLATLQQNGIGSAGVVRLETAADHRTFYAYTPDGRRDDTRPADHFARIGRPLPPALHQYVHSTPGQDDPHQYEPLALRPSDWPPAYDQANAVHFSPLALSTHLHAIPALRRRGLPQITADPGERYMRPDRKQFIQQFLPQVDAFLPSAQEVKSLLGADMPLPQAAMTLANWGAPVVVIKSGAAGALLYENGRLAQFPAYHQDRHAVVDVTGAGDAFCGGFMVGLAETGQAKTAVCYGLVSASFVIEGYGALYAANTPLALAHDRLRQIKKTATWQ